MVIKKKDESDWLAYFDKLQTDEGRIGLLAHLKGLRDNNQDANAGKLLRQIVDKWLERNH